ncbi:unnamed protein product [Withania somnifera]
MPRKHAVPVDARNKRKMKEVVMEELSSAAVLQQQQRLPIQQQRPTDQPNNLDKYLPRPFTSFTTLLNEDDDCVPGPLRRMYDQIDQITKSHSGDVRNMLYDTYRRYYSTLIIGANQEVGKKLIEKEEELRHAKIRIMELEQTISHLTYQGRHLKTTVRDLEIRSAVQDARLYAAARSEAARQQESVESSFVDHNRVKPPPSMGLCRVCFKADAAAIMSPCRHLCVCVSCATAVNTCPVCRTPKCATCEIVLP